MAAIQKVLGPRKKSPQDVERDTFIKQQAMHISKALNSSEGAPKEKHVRGVILGTFTQRSSMCFFTLATKLPIQSQANVCWKFLYIVNKMIRDGHKSCLKDSMKFVTLISELGKMWGRLRDSYGRPIAAFCKLILQKIRFHRKYILVPGNLTMSVDQLELMVGKDINNMFELSVDLMDCLDELLAFQDAVFSSLDRSRSNSMTTQGQSKLTPLIQCVQDAANLYDCLVKILFKLHACLSPDTLNGHRERFRKQYTTLQTFFQTAQVLQYFKNLIQVPALPENPPNFLIESGLASHKAPVVTVAQEVEEEEDGDFECPDDFCGRSTSDLSSTISDSCSESTTGNGAFESLSFNGNHKPDGSGALLLEIEMLKAESTRLREDQRERISSLLVRIKVLEEEVKGLVQMKERYEEKIGDLEYRKARQAQESLQHEEKFRKMRDIYSKLRDEHVELLRSKASVSKELENEKKQKEAALLALREKTLELTHLEHSRVVQAEVQQSSGDVVATEMAETKTRLLDAESAMEELQNQLSAAVAAKDMAQKKASSLESRLVILEQDSVSRTETLESLEATTVHLKSNLEIALGRAEKAESESAIRALEVSHLSDCKAGVERLQSRLLETSCRMAKEKVQETLALFDATEMLGCRGSPEFLLSRVENVYTQLEALDNIGRQYVENPGVVDNLVCTVNQFGSALCDCLLQGKAASHCASTLEVADEMVSSCTHTAELSLALLDDLSHGPFRWDQDLTTPLLRSLDCLRSLGEGLRPETRDVRPEEMGDLVDQEMRATAEMIEAAEEKCKELLEKSREDMTGVQLEVNEGILDSCTQLMNAVKALVEKSKVLQREIIAEGRGTASAGEYYKKHHRWTEGLISAAKTVGLSASTLVDAADHLLSGEGKFAELVVCSQEVAASTAQLVVSSRVKANPKSFSLSQLTGASKGVAKAAGRLVAGAKSAAQSTQDAEEYNFGALSLTQAKRLEIESQVRLFELEADLEKERVRLGDLRRQHYQLAGDSEEIQPQNSRT